MQGLLSLVAISSIPVLVLLLIVVAALDRMGVGSRLPWRKGTDRSLAAPGLDELTAFYSATKRHELDERQTSLMLRDEDGAAAPPRSRVDLDAGTAVLRVDSPGRRAEDG